MELQLAWDDYCVRMCADLHFDKVKMKRSYGAVIKSRENEEN